MTNEEAFYEIMYSIGYSQEEIDNIRDDCKKELKDK